MPLGIPIGGYEEYGLWRPKGEALRNPGIGDGEYEGDALPPAAKGWSPFGIPT